MSFVAYNWEDLQQNTPNRGMTDNMRQRLLFLLVGLAIALVLQSAFAENSATIEQMNSMPLVFTKNMGQWDDRVLFRANAGGAAMWFTREGITYQFVRRTESNGKNPVAGLGSRYQQNNIEIDSVEQLVLTAKLIGANPDPEIICEELMEYKCNYFVGNDPSKWRTDVPNYRAFALKDIYPGIDLRYSSDGNGQVRYEFAVTPGADIARITFEYEGAKGASVDADGRMVVITEWGDMIAPIEPPSSSVLSGTASVSQLPDKTTAFEADGTALQTLSTSTVVLAYSTYLGGEADDYGCGIAVDGSGSAYVTGYTPYSDFPLLNPYQTHQGNGDVFVTKLSSTGSSLVYSTYLGGGGWDYGYAIAVDGSGNAYVTGRTGSSDFPTLSFYQTDQGGPDVFVTKLSSSGNSLHYSTYLGGGGEDEGYGIAVDGSGTAYVTGSTHSSDFPVLNPYQTDQGGSDAFVTRLSSAGSSLLYSTYLGGGGDDYGYAVAVDGSDNAYVTGYAWSSDFPTLNPYQTDQGGKDLFVTKLSSAGSTLLYSTYVGGSDDDEGYGIAVDGSGNAYVTGLTSSSDFPTFDPYQTDQPLIDAFITKLNSSGSALLFSTYAGGNGIDEGHAIAVDGAGNVFVAGYTSSTNYPTVNPYQTDQPNWDVFVTKFGGSFGAPLYSTYLGGYDRDYARAIAVDGSGSVYITGETYSTNFPTVDPYQTDSDSNDVFVAKLVYPDADEDGIPDQSDNCPNTYNPDQADSDGDGIGNACDPDFGMVQTPDTADVFYIKQADIDGDNYSDVVYTGNTVDSLYIAYGRADGMLETPRNYLKVTRAALAVDFVDGDSLLDIVARTTGEVYVLLNAGNRHFSIDSQTVSLSSGTSGGNRSSVFPSIATGFFNDDTHIDIAVSENRILFGSGSGAFPTSVILPLSFDAVGVSDFDRSGTDDMVVTAGDSVFILLNDGIGNLSRSAALRIGYHVHDFASVNSGMDLNGDGKTDFVVLTGNTVGIDDTSVVTVALGDGGGGLTSYDTICIVGTALNLASVDVDKDGDLDLSVVNASQRQLQVYFNDGLAGFDDSGSTSLGSGTNQVYALASADLDRNGAPDFVVGGESGGNIILAVSEIPDDPILPDEMVTAGYNHVTLRVENPLGLVISRFLRTVAGSAYWRTDADDNGVLDESAYDYNLQDGEYRVVISCRTNLPVNPFFSAGIRIDGTAECVIFHGYEVPAAGDSLVFYYQVEPASSIYPANGRPTANPQPTFSWSGLASRALAADSYEFQLDRYYDFRSPIFSVTGLTSPQYHIPYSLGADSVFYWRIRPVVSGIPGAYTRTFAAYLLNYLCGDGNGDGTVNISDAVFLIAYIFAGGSTPDPLAAGDANCNGAVNISDAVYLIAYIFAGGPQPCAERK